MGVFKEDLFEIGTFSRLHGYEGGLVIRLNKLDSALLKNPTWLFVELHHEQVPWKIQEYQISDSSQIRIKLEDIDSQEKAKQLVHARVYVKEEDINTDSIEGIVASSWKAWSIYNHEEYVGTVEDLIQNKTQELLVVSYQNDSIYIPFVEAFITHIDKDLKKIYMDLPEGLLDL
jgi:16S rRNA processing protein RimM